MDVASPSHPSAGSGLNASPASGLSRAASNGAISPNQPNSPMAAPNIAAGGMAVFTPNSLSMSSAAAATAAGINSLNASLSSLAMRKEVSESAFEYLLAEMLNMAMPNMPEDEHVRNLLCIDQTYFLSCHIYSYAVCCI